MSEMTAEMFYAVMDEVRAELFRSGRCVTETDDLRITYTIDAAGALHTVVEFKE